MIRISFVAIASMAHSIIYASCNVKKGHPAEYVNGEQIDMRDNFVVVVAYFNCKNTHGKYYSTLSCHGSNIQKQYYYLTRW